MSKDVSIEEKARKESPQFVDEVQNLPIPELEKRLSDLAKGAEEVEDAKAADEELESLRAQVNELAAPYRDAKKAIRTKMRYIISLIKERSV